MINNKTKLISDIVPMALMFEFPFEYMPGIGFKLTVNHVPGVVEIFHIMLQHEDSQLRLQELYKLLKSFEQANSIN